RLPRAGAHPQHAPRRKDRYRRHAGLGWQGPGARCEKEVRVRCPGWVGSPRDGNGRLLPSWPDRLSSDILKSKHVGRVFKMEFPIVGGLVLSLIVLYWPGQPAPQWLRDWLNRLWLLLGITFLAGMALSFYSMTSKPLAGGGVQYSTARHP